MTTRAVLAVDLGTGGAKAALVDERAGVLASAFVPYATHYPAAGLHEQRPADWLAAVADGAREVLAGLDDTAVVAVSLSGQSLAYVPTAADLTPVIDLVPIWSDARAAGIAADVFTRVDADAWYLRTGNGFPAELYTSFEHVWFASHRPDVVERMRWLLGSKDWINAQLTGIVATDHSYASGLGAYSLDDRAYDPALLAVFGIASELLPPVLASTDVVGGLTADGARLLGLPEGTPVVAGGVDNACMALGAGLDAEGATYLSLGSSNWLTIASERPVLDAVHRPFVFAHVLPGLCVSALSTFAGGSSLQWLSELFRTDVGELLAEAAAVPVGAEGVVCVPTLAGGTVLEGGSDVRGAFVGLDLGHGRGALTRAVVEGVAFALGRAADELARHVELPAEVLAVGGGARSDLLLQSLADVLDRRVTRVANDQQSAALGAAALGLIGTGVWTDAAPLRAALGAVAAHDPDASHAAALQAGRVAFLEASASARLAAPALALARRTSTSTSGRTESDDQHDS